MAKVEDNTWQKLEAYINPETATVYLKLTKRFWEAGTYFYYWSQEEYDSGVTLATQTTELSDSVDTQAGL
jgi:hypothetical protein